MTVSLILLLEPRAKMRSGLTLVLVRFCVDWMMLIVLLNPLNSGREVSNWNSFLIMAKVLFEQGRPVDRVERAKGDQDGAGLQLVAVLLVGSVFLQQEVVDQLVELVLDPRVFQVGLLIGLKVVWTAVDCPDPGVSEFAEDVPAERS